MQILHHRPKKKSTVQFVNTYRDIGEAELEPLLLRLFAMAPSGSKLFANVREVSKLFSDSVMKSVRSLWITIFTDDQLRKLNYFLYVQCAPGRPQRFGLTSLRLCDKLSSEHHLFVANEVTMMLSRLQNLTSLDLTGSKQGAAWLPAAQPLKQLKSLTLRKSSLNRAEGNILDRLRTILSGMTRLTHLDLSGNDLSAANATRIIFVGSDLQKSCIKQLLSLDLSGNESLSQHNYFASLKEQLKPTQIITCRERSVIKQAKPKPKRNTSQQRKGISKHNSFSEDAALFDRLYGQQPQQESEPTKTNTTGKTVGGFTRRPLSNSIKRGEAIVKQIQAHDAQVQKNKVVSTLSQFGGTRK